MWSAKKGVATTMTGLKIRQLRLMKYRLSLVGLAVFALAVQPMYGLVASQVASALTATVSDFTVALPDTARPTVNNITIAPRINGNIGGTVTVNFDLEDATGIDLTKTRVLFADGPNASNAARESVKFTPVHVSGNTYKVEVDTLEFVKANWTGNYNLAFNLWDTLGNQGSSKPTDFRGILIDNSGPASVWTAPVNDSTISGITRFSFNVSDHTGVKSGYVKLNGITTKQVNLVQDGTSSVWYADLNTAELVDGGYTVDARFVDLFDKARYGANKGTVIIDNTAPIAAINAPTQVDSGIDPLVTGVASDALSGVKTHWFEVRAPSGTLYYVNGVSSFNLSAAQDNTVEKNPITLTDGEYRIRYVVTDNAGNRSDDPNYTNPTYHTLIIGTVPTVPGNGDNPGSGDNTGGSTGNNGAGSDNGSTEGGNTNNPVAEGDNVANGGSGSQNNGNQIINLIEAVLPTQPLLVTSLPTASAPQALALFSATTVAAQSADIDADIQDEQDTDKPSITAVSHATLSDTSEEGEVQAAQDIRASWSVVNTVLATIAAIAGLMTLLGLFVKRDDEGEGSRNGTRVVAVVLGGVSVVALILFEDFSAPISIVNWWTIAFGAVALVQIAIVTSLKAPKS